MKIFLLLTFSMMLISMAICEEIRAEEISVINVHRNIQLSETDPVFKDFYIDAGEGNGLKKNMVVQAIRKVSIRDASGVHAFGEIKIPVGQLKIIAVYSKIAVAREYKLLSRDDLPMLDQIGIMSGDLIELKGSFIDRRPNSLAPATPQSTASSLNNASPSLEPKNPIQQNSSQLQSPSDSNQIAKPALQTTPPADAKNEPAPQPPSSPAPAAAPAQVSQSNTETSTTNGETLN